MLISIYVNSVCYLFRDVINGIIILLCGICAAERWVHANAFPSKWILPVHPVWRRRRAESVTSSLCLVSACARVAHCVLMTPSVLAGKSGVKLLGSWPGRNKRRRASGWFSKMAETKPFSFSPNRIIKPHLYINVNLLLFCLIYHTVLKICPICWDLGSCASSFFPSTMLVMVVRITPACRRARCYCVESDT